MKDEKQNLMMCPDILVPVACVVSAIQAIPSSLQSDTRSFSAAHMTL